ncbi:MAG TPA: ABC transporter permease [Clostridiaceae bacterium]|jgi:ribose transport system permease protein|nr:ABC transporter permease [Clostridiaceae bacterium]
MKRFKLRLGRQGFVEKVGLIVALLLIILVFSLLNENYFSWQNLQNILTAASMTGLVAIGEALLIIGGLIDLSPGSIAALSSVLAGLFISWGVPPLLVIPCVIICGLLIGFLNALGINKLKLEPFIVTLSAMSIARGLGYILCGGKPVFINNTEFSSIGSKRILGSFTLPVIMLILAMIVFSVVLSRTKFGRSIYVLGGNPYAARLAGLNPERIKVYLFMISAGLAALGGGLLASRMQSSQPSSAVGLEFEGITAAVLGGVAMSGGIGNIAGVALGVLIIQCFNTGLIMNGVQTFWQDIARGILLILALGFDYYRRKKQSERQLKRSISEMTQQET